jgi:hypothetical protein
MIVAKCDEEAVLLIGKSDFETAVAQNQIAIDAIKVYEPIDDPELKQIIATAIANLQMPPPSARSNPTVAREAQARVASRSASARSNGVSIDPGSARTQSDMQRVLSDC